MLSDRLGRLVETGILERVPYGAGRHEYRLTAKGRELFVALNALRQWGDRYLAGQPMRVLRTNDGGTPVVAAPVPEGQAVLALHEVELLLGPGFPREPSP